MGTNGVCSILPLCPSDAEFRPVSYYQAYVNFFSRILLAKPNSIPSFLEDYVMSKDANVVPGKNGKKPLMLSRFMAGFLHPLIHSGYGTEFSMPGMISEGPRDCESRYRSLFANSSA